MPLETFDQLKLDYRPLFSFEVPLAHLKDFYPYQDYIFALSFQVETEPFSSFLKWAQGNGNLVVIDNSFNEFHRPDDPRKMINLFKAYNPSYVVAPDDARWTAEEAVDNFKMMTEEVPPERIMAVVRSEEEYALYKKAGAALFGVSYRHRQTPLEVLYKSDECHFLGLNNMTEILHYFPRSIDTSMPVKLAMRGMSLLDWFLAACPHIHTYDICSDFFTAQLDKATIDLAISNIQDLLGMCLNLFLIERRV